MDVLRILGAVVLGFLTSATGIVAATAALAALVPAYGRAGSAAPPAEWAAVQLLGSGLCVFAGAYLAQWVAGGPRPIAPLVLGALIVVLSLASPGEGTRAWPAWYRAGLLLMPLPMAVLGGLLRLRFA